MSANTLEDFHLSFYENYKESYPSLSLFENCCQVNFENCIQHMENYYGDEELMDEEIRQFCEDYFQHQEGMLEGSCQDIQEKLYQTVTIPLAKNEIYQQLDVDIHVPFLEFNEDILILSD